MKMIINLVMIISIIVTICDTASAGNCSCSPNTDFNDYAAIEYTAISCTPDANGRYTYIIYGVQCVSNIIKDYLPLGDTPFPKSPDEVINQYASVYRVLRNPSGTHILVMVPISSRITSLLGVSVPSTKGISTIDELDQYCTQFPVNDSDGDGYPDCLDCDIDNPDNPCLHCDEYHQTLINDCKGEGNILYWDADQCKGRCLQNANFGGCK